MEIVLTDRPIFGQMDRICKICGDSYFGFNFVACRDCEYNKVYYTTKAY
jgi:hypothetical protein